MVPPVRLVDIKDNPGESRPGWNFVKDERNRHLYLCSPLMRFIIERCILGTTSNNAVLLALSLVRNSYQVICLRTCDSFEAFCAANSDGKILKSMYMIGIDVMDLFIAPFRKWTTCGGAVMSQIVVCQTKNDDRPRVLGKKWEISDSWNGTRTRVHVSHPNFFNITSIDLINHTLNK